MDDTITINGIVYVKQGAANKRLNDKMGYFYISIPHFAERLDISHEKARIIVQRKDLCDKGIAVTINDDGGKGGKRINWIKYVDFVEKNPAVPEEMRVRKRA